MPGFLTRVLGQALCQLSHLLSPLSSVFIAFSLSTVDTGGSVLPPHTPRHVPSLPLVCLSHSLAGSVSCDPGQARPPAPCSLLYAFLCWSTWLPLDTPLPSPHPTHWEAVAWSPPTHRTRPILALPLNHSPGKLIVGALLIKPEAWALPSSFLPACSAFDRHAASVSTFH